MKYYLYKFNDNWADEMDMEGFIVLTEPEKDMALTKIKKEFKRGGTITFGSNEDSEYDSLQDVMNCVEIDEITKAEYFMLKKLFDSGKMGQLGPIDLYDFDIDEDENYGECEECGADLEENDGELCVDCREEMENDDDENKYESNAKKIRDFIQKEYGLECTHSTDCYAKFVWKPTTESEIEIIIGNYDDGDEEVEITLKIKNKERGYEFFYVDDIYEFVEDELKPVIKEFVEKAKKF